MEEQIISHSPNRRSYLKSSHKLNVIIGRLLQKDPYVPECHDLAQSTTTKGWDTRQIMLSSGVPVLEVQLVERWFLFKNFQ